MAGNDFTKEITEALNFTNAKEFTQSAAASLKKNRKSFLYYFGTALKSMGKLKKGLQEIANRMVFKSSPIRYKDGSGAVDPINDISTQFSFLSFPTVLSRRRRKDGTYGKGMRLEGVNVGNGFKKYEGVFVANIKGKNVPLRASRSGKLKSMQVNIYNLVALNPSKFEKATEPYSKLVMQDLEKRIIKRFKRKLNKNVKLKLNK